MPKPLFALVDGNSFFASCEKVFRPDLIGKPVIVLSNNDGCVVAATKEAKSLGIRRGDPFFRIEELCLKNQVAVFSSNYELYGDLSWRMMSNIAAVVGKIEPYSIDECFADMSGFESLGTNLTEFGHKIKDTVYREVGIPTCVGIGPSKTLAKYCNYLAKRYRVLNGVCNWMDLTEHRQQKALQCQPVSEVWGVGRRYSTRLNEMGIQTALDLANADQERIGKIFGKPLSMTILELRGESCIPLGTGDRQRKQILRSASFGNLVADKDSLQGALSFHATEVARLLRKEKIIAHVVGIILETNRFRESDPQYHVFPAIGLPYAVNDTRTIIRTASRLLNRYYRKGFLYKRGGVYATELVAQDEEPRDLFESLETEKQKTISATMDAINKKFGKDTLYYASSQLGKENWVMKRFHLSPRHAARREDIPAVG